MKQVFIGLYTLALLAVLFLFTRLEGDLGFFLEQVFLTKVHLLRELAMPYFTPGFCGGMALAADAQNQIFTLSTPISFLFDEQYLALRITIFLYSVVFALGIYFWLAYVPGLSSASRAFAALLACTSGFWVLHMKFTHVAFHGIAYIPWIFLLAELPLRRRLRVRELFSLVLVFTLLLFLLLNSGAIWAQVLIFLASARLLVELVDAARKRSFASLLQLTGVLAAAGLFALLISAGRYVSIFEFTLRNFPRDLEVGGVFGGARHALLATARGFFDPRVVTQQLFEPHLGGVHEWSSYLGMFALVAVLASLPNFRELGRGKIFRSLLLASAAQFLFTVRPFFWETIRRLLPVFHGISYYYRGVIIISLLLIVMAAYGLEALLQSRFRAVRVLAGALPFLCGAEFLVIYQAGAFLQPPQPAAALRSAPLPEKLVSYRAGDLSHFAQGAASGGCYNPPINGYAVKGTPAEKFNSRVNYDAEIVPPDSPPELNMNDVEKLFSPENPRGYYKAHPWPLWPRERAGELELFLRLKRGYRIPREVRIAESVSEAAFLAWLLACLYVLARRRKFSLRFP